MSAKLVDHGYGKSHVRVMKVLRDGARHTIKELDVSVMLRGDFESSYTVAAGDNSKVVATDTMKNTVNVLAKEHLGRETERFVARLTRHFPQQYPQVSEVTVEAHERCWEPLAIDGKPHPHSFSSSERCRPFARAIVADGGFVLESGVSELLILKSAGSGFEGYPRCRLTTLPETNDRIFATSLTATWTWRGEPADYNAANQLILAALLAPFAENYSPSVQATLFQMGEAALAACPEITRVHLSAPNKHCLLLDLSRFGVENENELFVPTDEPHGQIEATVARA